MQPIDISQFPRPVQAVFDVFDFMDMPAFLVGGAVRDLVLGRPVHDFDFTTAARPDQIKRILAATGAAAVVPIGEKYGTIKAVYPDGLEVEVTTFRGERYQPGSRKPEVVFGHSLADDLGRRDFTFNAMALNKEGEIIDPFGGLADLNEGWIRLVGEDKGQRLVDDPLRMLRAVRFACQLGFVLTQSTLHLIQGNSSMLQTISAERIRDEFVKMLLSNPYKMMFLLEMTGLMEQFLPEVHALRGVTQEPFHRMDVFDHTQLVVNGVPDRLVTRLAALFHDIAKPVTKTVVDGKAHFYGHEDTGAQMTRNILGRLRFDSSTIESVVLMVSLHMRFNQYRPQWSDATVRRLMLDSGKHFWDLLDLAAADRDSDLADEYITAGDYIEELKHRCARLEMALPVKTIQSPLSGYELMTAFGRGNGKWVGQVKTFLEESVMEGYLGLDDKQEALLMAQDYVKRMDTEVVF